MRVLALLPLLFCIAAFILTVLCLFAGSHDGFLADYSLVTLNTSRIGQNLFTNTSRSSSNPLVEAIENATNTVEGDIQDVAGSIAKDLGLHDFYSMYLTDYCEGYYTPGPVPNKTLSKSHIKQNVTSCSNGTSIYNFNPEEILQKELNNTGHSNINLSSDINWPQDVSRGLRALHIIQTTMFVLYCIAVGFIGLAIISAVVGIFLQGRVSAFCNVLLDWLAFIIIGVASALATAFADKAANVINKYGNPIGLYAHHGTKFLVLTWVATGLMLIASMVWCFDCIVGMRKPRNTPKYG